MPAAVPRRVGFFGLLGSGNTGNDASLAALLTALRTRYPDAELSCMCAGPSEIATRYGLPTTPMHWYSADDTRSRTAVVRKAFGKLADAFRTAAWVRRHDVVMVPGMGVLEATLPLRPWGVPYALVLLGLAGRCFGTKVAYVCVGAAYTTQPVTRYLIAMAARLAHYRSYRDALSKAAMTRMGVDTTGDHVYADLAFALPAPEPTGGRGRTVGVGVMAYHGTTLDRRQADTIHDTYRTTLRGFVAWLAEHGYAVRLFIGDAVDEHVTRAIVDQLPAHGDVTVVPTTTYDDLLRAMADVDYVVASRYHNLLAALLLGRPTVSISYAEKNDALLADAGLADFCHPLRSLHLSRLVTSFDRLAAERDDLVADIREANARNAQRLEEQFHDLATTLFAEPAQPSVQPS
ncbi:MAG: hypothetical protein GEV07_09970 [Streptosporangiales bacterium]|nr:hypothetical protein [Streptosporangiales bacterium]